MKLLRGKPKLQAFARGVVATIGTFDGVHLGHQNLIRALRAKADTLKLPLVIILFEPQPREYFLQDKAPTRLSSLREKVHYLKECLVDYVYCVKFDKKLAQTTAKDFALEYLFERLQVKYLSVGADFRFGKDRQGDLLLLQELGARNHCDVHLSSDFCLDHEKISSTKIRAALQQDNLSLAHLYLGRPYSLCGRVIRGKGLGRQWGIPTANLSLHRKTLAVHGVFAVMVKVGNDLYNGVANVGNRPTVDGKKNILEAHLFDYNESLYGEIVQVFFLHNLRKEVKFTTVEALIEQIHKDINTAKNYFAQHKQLTIF